MTVLAILLALSFQSIGAPDVSSNIQLIEKRIELKQEMSQLRNDWLLEQSELEQESALLDAEIENLSEKLESLVSINSELIEREKKAIGSIDELDRIMDRLKKSASRLEEKLLDLNLPPPLISEVNDELGPLELREKQSTGTRFRAIMQAINLIHRFNKEPFFYKDSYSIDGDTTKQLDTLFFGLAIGYRIDPSGSIAQVGRPAESGWRWEDANVHAHHIQRVMNIYKKTEMPTYVELPLSSSHD